MASGEPPEASDSTGPSNSRELKLVSHPRSSSTPEPASDPSPGPPSSAASPSTSTSGTLPPSPSDSAPEQESTARPSSARPAAHATAADAQDSARRGLPIWLFIVLFLVAALAIGWQFRLAGQLEREIAGLESELEATTALLGAHQSRLVEIRGGVRDLAVQLDGLKALVDAEPAESLSAAQPSREGASASSDRGEVREIPARLPR